MSFDISNYVLGFMFDKKSMLTYQRFTQSVCKDKGIRNFFLAKTQFLCLTFLLKNWLEPQNIFSLVEWVDINREYYIPGKAAFFSSFDFIDCTIFIPSFSKILGSLDLMSLMSSLCMHTKKHYYFAAIGKNSNCLIKCEKR